MCVHETFIFHTHTCTHTGRIPTSTAIIAPHIARYTMHSGAYTAYTEHAICCGNVSPYVGRPRIPNLLHPLSACEYFFIREISKYSTNAAWHICVICWAVSHYEARATYMIQTRYCAVALANCVRFISRVESSSDAVRIIFVPAVQNIRSRHGEFNINKHLRTRCHNLTCSAGFYVVCCEFIV